MNANLNLLRVFDALFKERHVTRAGRRIGITQSAMSNALNRLRETFGDELFIKTPQGMLPTARAEALSLQISEVLQRTEQIFMDETPLDLKQLHRTVGIGVSDYVSPIVLPHLYKILRKHAPNVHLNIQSTSSIATVDYFDRYQLDVVIGLFNNIPDSLYQQELFQDEPVCVGCKKNMLLKKPISMENLLASQHIVTRYESGPQPYLGDKLLADHGYPARKVVITLPFATQVFEFLHGTNLLTITGRRLAEHYKTTMKLAIQPLPIAAPNISISQVWSKKFQQDQFHQWLRTQIKSIWVC